MSGEATLVVFYPDNIATGPSHQAFSLGEKTYLPSYLQVPFLFPSSKNCQIVSFCFSCWLPEELLARLTGRLSGPFSPPGAAGGAAGGGGGGGWRLFNILGSVLTLELELSLRTPPAAAPSIAFLNKHSDWRDGGWRISSREIPRKIYQQTSVLPELRLFLLPFPRQSDPAVLQLNY